MALSREKFNEVITTFEFNQLIGEVENVWFDCKSQPYQVQDDVGKRELAKDVSSFANVQGGIILIGIKTEKSAVHFGDEIKAIRPFSQDLLDPSQYKNIIKAWIYPEVEGIDIEWLPTKENSAKGVVVIKIPVQKESLKPFLITKTLDGNKRVEIVFGYAERKGDSSMPTSVIDLQRALRSGFNYERELQGRLDGMETLLSYVAGQSVDDLKKKINIEIIETRIQKALTHEDMSKKRALVISAYPIQPGELKTVFLTSDQSIKKQLENPPILRSSGWGLGTLDQAKIIRGEMIRVTNGDRKVIDLYRDGTLVFAGLANHKFLAWHDAEKQKINVVALVEIIYSFVRFYELVLKDFKESPKEIYFRIDLKNMHLQGIKNYLVPYQLGSEAQIFDIDSEEAPDNNWEKVISFPVRDYDTAVIAYEILKEVYLWFGLEEDKIPYVKSENGVKVVDVDAIINIK